jgi:hypothetical protein
MANEQTSVPLYAALEVLTAANMNISAGTGVPVFATTVTRDAAFGGANEKTLAEGQLCYLSASNIVQYYDGAAWATVGPVTSPGLVCVKAETAFGAVGSFTADSIFTSTYTNYRIVFSATSSASSSLSLVLRVGGVSTITNYNDERLYVDGTTNVGGRVTGQTSQRLGDINGAFFSVSTIEMFNPFVASQATNFMHSTQMNFGGYTVPTLILHYGNQSASTQFDGFSVAVASGTITGTFTVYGYSKAV